MNREDRLVELLVALEDAASGAPKTPEEICGDCPELLSDFRKLLADLGPVDEVLTGGVGLTPGLDFDAGRYRAVWFHARGGLGEVFAATDGELQRTVALKRIQGLAALDPAARRRFVREAEITGHLEHPGVVPVYGLSRDSDGRPFYAMRFVRGRTLGQEIDRFHGRSGPAEPTDPADRNVEFRRLISGFVSVCQTIAYAHAQGVIHRDIKPHNVMVGPYGETLVLDWGLAKCVGRPGPGAAARPAPPGGSADSTGPHIPEVTHGATGEPADPVPNREPSFADLVREDAPTAPGTVLGTPAYMSPEQAGARAAGPAADVYSLGATLYSLLTGRRAFEGDSTADILRRVQSGTFDPPRSANPAVPRPLAAVCRKAMALDPAARYSGAAELAKDLERWLASEPVTAWREPFPVRARRWLNRHRTLVAAVVFGVAVAAVATGVASVLLAEKNQQLTATIGDRDRALRERDASNQELRNRNAELAAAGAAARADFESADDAVGGAAAVAILRTTGGRVLPDPVRKAILTQSRDYYRGFLARNADRPELALAVALASVKQAEAEFALGNDDAAAPLLGDARRRFARILTDSPGDPEAEYGAATADTLSGTLLVIRLQPEEARPFVIRACEVLAQLCEKPHPKLARFTRSESPAFRLARAAVTYRDLDVHRDPRQTPFGELGPQTVENPFANWARKAEAVLRAEVVRTTDTPPEIRAMLAAIGVALGEEEAALGRADEAEKLLREARVGLAEVIKELPTEANELEMLVHAATVQQALLLRRRGLPRDAERETTQARDRLQELARRPWGADEHGVRDRVRLLAGLASRLLGAWAVQDKDTIKAANHYRAALDAFNEVATEPGRSELSLRVTLLKGYEQIVVATGQAKLGDRLVTDALDRCRGQFAALGPDLRDVPWFRRERAFIDVIYAMYLMEHTEENPHPLTERAVRELDAYTRQHPEDELGPLQYAVALVARGSARRDTQLDEALADLNAARAKLVRKWNEPALREQAGKIRRQTGLMIVSSSILRGQAALTRTPPDRAKARAVAATGLEVLKDVEIEAGPLATEELKLRHDLEAIRLRADK